MNISSKIFIYGLYTNKNSTIRYVGKTKISVKHRLSDHIRESIFLKNHKDKWIQKALKNNEKILAKIIEITDEKLWKEREIYWIKKLKNKNRLTNSAKGGEGGGKKLCTKSYKYLKSYVSKNYPNIKSKNQWKKYFTNLKNKPAFIPINPEQIYKNLGWVSWGDFLKTNRIQSNIIYKNLYIKTYKKAKIFLKKYNLKSRKEFIEFKNKNIISNIIPLKPQRFYKKRGWVSWGDFLGTGNVFNKPNNFVNYEECKKWVNNNLKDLINGKDYMQNYKYKKIPNNIPKYPHIVYKNKGWETWSKFLEINYLKYDECKKYIKNNYPNIKNKYDFKKKIINNKLFPKDIEYFYKKDKSWKGWKDFFTH